MTARLVDLCINLAAEGLFWGITVLCAAKGISWFRTQCSFTPKKED
jgi:hypothetical protein